MKSIERVKRTITIMNIMNINKVYLLEVAVVTLHMKLFFTLRSLRHNIVVI